MVKSRRAIAITATVVTVRPLVLRIIELSPLSASQKEGAQRVVKSRGAIAIPTTEVTFKPLVLQSLELSPLFTSQRGGTEGGQIQGG